MELLAVVEAEEQADALIQEAQLRKEQAIRNALKERGEQLAKLKLQPLPEPAVKVLKPNLEVLKAKARQNKAKAIKRILEEINAA